MSEMEVLVDDPSSVGESLEEMGDGEELESVAESSGSGLFSGLGPLSNTSPNPDIESVDSPRMNREYGYKFLYRGMLKIQGGATALADFIWGFGILAFASFQEPEDVEESETSGSPGGEPGRDSEELTPEDVGMIPPNQTEE